MKVPGDEGGGMSDGPATDRKNDPVIDPTSNVRELVDAAIQRQDDLRRADKELRIEVDRVRDSYLQHERTHLRELTELRGQYDDKLREAEANRIDAIRAVDVGAVNRAAEVATLQASTLATQVAQSAEALRNQVAAAATAQTVALAAALEPIIKDIADLRRAQYEAQGQKAQVVETRQASGSTIAAIGLGISILVAVLLVVTFVIARGSGAA